MDTEITRTPEEENPETPEPAGEPNASPGGLGKISTYILPLAAWFRGLSWYPWLLVAFIAGMAASYLIFARPLDGELTAVRAQLAALQQGEADAAAQPEVPQQVTRYDIPVDDDPGFGPQDAPILIVEFSDYECPFCQKWHAETWPQIQEKYGDQVRLVYRDFPLYSIHANALSAAMAANCANDQGKYWEYHSALFSSRNPYSRATFDAIAVDLKLDEGDFAVCMDTQKYKDEVDADYQFAENLGVQSTPTFFINGLALVGAQPFSVFDKIISMELNGEIPQ